MKENRKAIVFQTGNGEYGISIKNILSIEKLDKITPIPHLPSYVSGMIKVRDELIPVLDFNKLLYHVEMSDLHTSRLIVLKTESITFGIIVDEAKEIVDIPEQSLKQVGILAYSNAKYFSGVVNLSDRLITMIDPEILVESLESIKDIKEYVEEKKEEMHA
ncbi:purine-binding chemotaxis protein CheW [Bacillus pakistanensis]|uniref:Purine-binding chemotaxis protein CheW n=1 Tax=Rossellomorea pakistanensis TaxID=992288 RepID=A0ABS2N9V2_9BACI|nr:chemotaxis protein CheW [Bacillus pakistanensis]MBM7584539.1 purine-binding chemotaxis protein CheW [Bacillus pakistanensis]